MDINSVTLAGRIVEDCKSFFTQDDIYAVSFTISSNRIKRKDGIIPSDNFDITLLGLQAEKLAKYLVKGKQIAVQGCLREHIWTDNEGFDHSKIYIKADFVQLLGGVRT